MSLYDYKVCNEIAVQDYPFYALIMAAMKKADSFNAQLLRSMYPGTWQELEERYNAPGGVLAND